MRNDGRIGRLGLLAGLGLVAALATPGAASADTFDPNDFAISIDGITLFQVGTATAHSALGDIAIADGNNSTAIAGAAMATWRPPSAQAAKPSLVAATPTTSTSRPPPV
jgi:hypothetical protein